MNREYRMNMTCKALQNLFLTVSAVTFVGCVSNTDLDEVTNSAEDGLSGTKAIKVVLSGHCADGEDGSTVVQSSCSNGSDQAWRLTGVSTDIYTFASVSSGKC